MTVSKARSFAAATAFMAVVVGSAEAQKRSDFSGTFVLAVDRSDFGAMPGPASRTDIIDHKNPSIVIKRTVAGPAGDATVTLTMAVDGKPHKNSTPQGELSSVLAWEGDVLVMTTNLESPNGPVTIVDRMSLSADGKTLTQKRAIAVGGQSMAQTMVLDKK